MSHFLHLGPARCATTWQARVFSDHPSLFVPMSKDTEYFSHQSSRGEAWYRQQFSRAQENQIQGELCHRYFWHPEAPARAQAFNPQFKIIVTLRDPFDRIMSAYQYDRTLYLNSAVTLTEYLNLPVVRATNDYTGNLQRWQNHFDAKNILLTMYEDIDLDEKKWLESIWSHLHVPSHWEDSWSQPLWRARVARNETLAHFSFSVSQLLRRHGFFQLVGFTKNQSWVEKTLFRDGKVSLQFSNSDWNNSLKIIHQIYDRWEGAHGSLPIGWRRPDERA